MPGYDSIAHLSDNQRQKVRENIGLVRVHLRRHACTAAGAPTRDREWDDLFQEGCLGLIEAARSFPADGRIPFAAYALPRIHTAVSRALRGAFATVRQPLYPRQRPDTDRHPPPAATTTLEFDPRDRRPDPRHAPLRTPGVDSVGQRLRARYERTVRKVAVRMQHARPARPDRALVVHRVVEERLLVPEPAARVSLRRLARETRSSYARIAQCEKRLLALVRAELVDDAETLRLRAEADGNPQGMDTPIDRALDDELEQLRIDRFVASFDGAPPKRQAALLLDSMKAAGTCVQTVARQLAASLPPQRRAKLLASTR